MNACTRTPANPPPSDIIVDVVLHGIHDRLHHQSRARLLPILPPHLAPGLGDIVHAFLQLLEGYAMMLESFIIPT